MSFFHNNADIQTSNIGEHTNIWQYVVVLPQAKIGSHCNICAHCFIENDVIIGNNVTIKNGVQVWDGVYIKDRVFIGPNVTFTNDLYPRSQNPDFLPARTTIERGASIGANATILAGVKIGKNALIGAGSVVTKDVPAHTVWYGNPAQLKGYTCDCGKISKKEKTCSSCQRAERAPAH